MVKRVILLVALLFASNSFMNVAWYGHLKYKSAPLWLAIAASWGIALFEYCFQVPANRIGSGALSLTQLKITQEIITLITFAVFSFVVFKEKPTTNHLVSFGFIVGAAYFAVKK